MKAYLEKGEHPPESSATQKETMRRLANDFFLNKEVLYKRTPNLRLFRCLDAEEARKFLKEVHAESIITDNGANMNSHLMKDISEQFKITHRNSTAYRSRMSGAIDAANKNIKRILRKMVDNYKNWHEQLPYALLGYRTTTRTSTRATPYLLVYGTEAVIPADVEIPSLRVLQEAELKDAEWFKNYYEQLAMIEEKRMVTVCHGQLYRQRMSRAFNKIVRTLLFQIRKFVLKRVFPHQEEY
ncbi:uncharacterized protein LOC132612143 [Lycium barbarum]|uniref:uncharacterized protein LOC132612143 n=1 Tax=Lycium barbarum TaxID=112863 RepID=UPI00293F10A9|nr:uncharacterized protein LOC132612143 [Lycium barbarum]